MLSVLLDPGIDHSLRRVVVIGLTMAGLCVASPASADLDAYMTLTVGGNVVQGDVTQTGREGTIRVRAVSLDGFSPLRSGGSVSAAQSRPVSLLIDVDRSAPPILGAWASGNVVNEAVIRFYQPNQFGAEENYLTLTLSNGRVSSYALSSPDNLDPALASRPATVLVGFTYANALLEHELSGQAQAIGWQ